MKKNLPNPYNLKIGTVYTLDTLPGFYIVEQIASMPSSRAVIFTLTFFHPNDKSNTDTLIWHQYGDYSNLIRLKEAPKVVQILYGKTDS